MNAVAWQQMVSHHSKISIQQWRNTWKSMIMYSFAANDVFADVLIRLAIATRKGARVFNRQHVRNYDLIKKNEWRAMNVNIPDG